ncbi:TRAP transporter small permease [Luteimonas sp. XNQY3]|nr:TRAP transporter small permease [Luteimonas sp. XNQY3]MCD9005829.1 TRAP transporter small permease [Luteimonas sp. XNQY3]
MSEDTTLAPEDAPKSALDRLADAVIAVAATALFGLVIVQGWQVFARYVINDSPSWTEPVTLLLLATAMSFGAAAGVRTRRHFGFFLLQDHMRPAIRRLVDLLVPLVIVAIGAVIAYWGAVLLFDGLHIKAAGASMPQSINYLPLSIGGALMAVFALDQFVGVLRAEPVGEDL